MTSAPGGRWHFTPFLDLLLVWNKGVSYGLFDTNSQGILVGLSLLVCCVLWIWLCRSFGRLPWLPLALSSAGPWPTPWTA